MTDVSAIQLKREAAAARLRCEAALLGTLLLHGLFLYAFRVETTTNRQVLAAASPDCILVSPFSESLPWERMIHAWCLLADPTLLSLPNDELGFGYLRRSERSLPMTHAPEYVSEIALVDEKPPTELALSHPLAPLASEVHTKWRLAPVPVPAPPSIAPLPSGLLWRRPDGTALPDAPEVDKEAVRRALETDGSPTAPTRLELDRHVGPTRILVRTSSGNSTLDLLAVSALRRDLFPFECRRQYVAPRGSPPQYYPKAGACSTIEVEWRLLQPPREAPTEQR